MGCELELVEGAAANGFRNAPPPLFSGAAAVGFAPNGFGDKDEGFDAEEKGFDAKGEAAGFCEADGQPLPPNEDIVFSNDDDHLGRYGGGSRQSQSPEAMEI